MITTDIPTLKIHKLSKEQYERELAAGNLDEDALYFTPDEEYYTETEIDSKLSNKSDKGHTHDDRYYTETEIDSKLDLKVPVARKINGITLSDDITLTPSNIGAAASSHTHDDRYYTETEMDSKLSGKVDSTDAGLNAVINKLSTGSSTPTDNDYYVSQYAGGGTTTVTYHRRPMSALWSYIKGKADSTYQAKGNYAAASHTHDDRYYTETEVDTKLDAKVPTSRTVNGKALSANISLTASDVGASASNHTHNYLPLSGGTVTGMIYQTKAGSEDIGIEARNTDTNAAVRLQVGSGKYNRGVYDMTASKWMLYSDQNNNVILNGNAATATKATTADSATSATKATSLVPVTTAGDGAAYTATVNGITALTVGANFIMNPHVLSTSTTPTLNVNGLGAKTIRVQLSNSSSTAVAPAQANFLGPNKPVEVVYNGSFWVAQLIRPDASTIYGTVAIAKGGTGATTAAAALANLGAMPAAQTMTTAEYNALTTKDAATLYLLTDDTEEDDVKAHVANTTVHITSGERTKWNAKCDVSSGTSAPTSDTSGDIYIKKNSNGTGIDAVYLKI